MAATSASFLLCTRAVRVHAMFKSMAASILTISLACLATVARADCPPEKFLLMEDDNFWQDDKLRLAFLVTMDQGRFEQAKSKFGGGGNFPIEGAPIETYADFEKAKAAGLR